MVLGRVYCILIGDDWYIGSTVLSLSRRMLEHKYRSKIDSSRKVYTKALEIGWDECIIELIEEIEVENVRELSAVENTYIDLTNINCLNSMPSYKTSEESKEHKLQHDRQYREQHKEQKRQHNQKTKDRQNELRRIRRANKRAEIISQV
jgi:hypothetical protein